MCSAGEVSGDSLRITLTARPTRCLDANAIRYGTDGSNDAGEHRRLAVRVFCCVRRVADGVKNASQDLASVAEVLSEYGKVGACDLVAEVAYGAIENGVEEFHLFVI